jgi:acetyl-CoA C-acetyltransferase
MSLDPRSPVIIGVGQVLDRASDPTEALEPAELMARSVRAAFADAGLGGGPRRVDSIRVINLLSWKYLDPARFVAERLGVETGERVHMTGGGNSPQSLVNITALDLLTGRADLVVLTGAESWRSRMRARKAGIELNWTQVPEGTAPDRTIGSALDMSHPVEIERGIMMPVQMYPMFESVLRATAGRSPAEHTRHIAELWARFAAVAADNPNAWIRSAPSATEIATAGPTNRMIGLPYPKLMNSNNDVDMGAAVVMSTLGRARELGVPDDRIVFVHAGTDAHEHPYASERWSFAETPAVEIAGRSVLELAGADIDAVDVIDLYSCFPSAVQIGAKSLGLSLDRQLTRTGGLSFGGGPWNNYVMHAIAKTVDDLRERPGELGLVWGNGGYVTKHAFGVYGTEPPAAGFRHASPQEEIDALPRRVPVTADDASGASALIESYTVMHDRDGTPETGIVTALLADGRRAWATSSERGVATAMCEGEWVGRSVTLRSDGGFAPAD